MNIRFTELAFQRYRDNCFKQYPENNSLDDCISSLMKWEPFDSTILIMGGTENVIQGS